MNKVNFSWNINSKKLDKMKSAIADNLLSDPAITKIIQSLNMTSEEIDKYLGWLLSLQETLQICKNCQGINKCQNEFKGMIPSIQREDEKLVQVYKPCELFYKNSNYLIKDFHGIFDDASLMNIKNTNNLSKLIAKMFSYLENIEQKGFTLIGKSGSGKTYALAALTNELAKNGIKCAFADTKKLVNNLKQMLYNKEKNSYEDLLESLCNVPVLVLDNLGDETKTEWSRDELLGTILTTRNKNNLLTFVTTKYELSELLTLYSSIKTKTGYNANKLMADSFMDNLIECSPLFGKI